MNLPWNEALVRMRAGKRIVADFLPANDYWTCTQQGKVMNSNGAIINTQIPEIQDGEYRELIPQENFNVARRIQFANLMNDFYQFRINDPEIAIKKGYELIEYDLSEEAKQLFKAMDVYFKERLGKREHHIRIEGEEEIEMTITQDSDFVSNVLDGLNENNT